MGTWLSLRFFRPIAKLPLSVKLCPWLQILRGFTKGIPALLGLVLLAAAALKAHQLATDPPLESGLLTSRWTLIGLVELELGLGLCLLLGIYPPQIRIAALVTFAAFALMSLQQAIAGKASCSCFGAVAVRPWFTLFLPR
jgi:hypothetical protein